MNTDRRYRPQLERLEARDAPSPVAPQPGLPAPLPPLHSGELVERRIDAHYGYAYTPVELWLAGAAPVEDRSQLEPSLVGPRTSIRLDPAHNDLFADATHGAVPVPAAGSPAPAPAPVPPPDQVLAVDVLLALDRGVQAPALLAL